MKHTIARNKFKGFLRRKFNVDLTDKITMITSKYDIPEEFIGLYLKKDFERLLNDYGPFFLIEGNNARFLVQDRGYAFKGIDNNQIYVEDEKIMENLGIKPLKLKLGYLIDLYFDESDV